MLNPASAICACSLPSPSIRMLMGKTARPLMSSAPSPRIEARAGSPVAARHGKPDRTAHANDILTMMRMGSPFPIVAADTNEGECPNTASALPSVHAETSVGLPPQAAHQIGLPSVRRGSSIGRRPSLSSAFGRTGSSRRGRTAGAPPSHSSIHWPVTP